VITDVDMPRLDGIGLIRSIRQDGRLRKVPIIVMSYRASAEERQRGLDAGANVYLTKANYEDQSLLDNVFRLLPQPNLQ
jgi:two-component system sensor histidine kinase and response regulator WspE